MPIHYVALMNQYNVVVLQGSHQQGVLKTGSNFKSSVVKLDSHIRTFAIKEQKLDDRLTLVYSNRDQVTAVLVKTNEIDFEECGKFFDHFY